MPNYLRMTLIALCIVVASASVLLAVSLTPLAWMGFGAALWAACLFGSREYSGSTTTVEAQ